LFLFANNNDVITQTAGNK